MTRLIERRSIVGIDPTPRGLAFVFFERGELLDWGHSSAERGEKSVLRLIDRLVDGCAADVLVLEDPDAAGCKRRPRIRELLRLIAGHARKRGILVRRVSRQAVRSARGASSKENASTALAELFSDLLPFVPNPRKAFEAERLRVNIFDALSLVLQEFPPEERPVGR